jgi:hypothetical protein
MSNEPSAPERVQAAFRQLSATAISLNAASDELGKTITELDAALKYLNLGIPAWVQICGNEDENGDFWSRNIGYARIGNQWGIALGTIRGNNNFDHADEEEWLFNDAPRWMRIEGIAKIPELLEKLTKQASDTTERIKKKTAEAKELAVAIKAAAAEPKPTNKLSPTPPSLSKPVDAGSKPSLGLPLTPPTAHK